MKLFTAIIGTARFIPSDERSEESRGEECYLKEVY